LRLVIDASVALPWFFADEKSDESDRVLAEVYRDGAVAPVIWPIEVANALATIDTNLIRAAVSANMRLWNATSP
jgi:predicted nucleic acid-binding protein